MADALRGYSGEAPADPKDDREYVSIYVAVDRSTRKPAYFAFHVDPRAAADQGLFFTFTQSTKENGQWKSTMDGDGATGLAFDSCDKDSCVARVSGGLLTRVSDHKRIDLQKFLNSDSILLLYVRDGKSYRTMVLLSSFKKAYKNMLETKLASTR